MDDIKKQLDNHPKPQPADRLEEHELRPGETVQIPQPKRLVGMPIESKPNLAEMGSDQVVAPPVQTNPRFDLTPRSEKATRFSKLSDKQKQALDKLKKMKAHKHWHTAKILVITLLVFLLIFNSQWFIAQFMYYFNRPANTNTTTQTSNNQTQQQNNQQNNTQQPTQAQVVGPENEIIIPKINVRAPLVFIDTINEADVLRALQDGVVHYAGTAVPGENGNAAFFGHSSNDWWEPGNYKFVFVNLEKLTVGDTYEIHYNSRKYVYTVQSTKVVEPNDLTVLDQTSYPSSTLITCTPPGTSWRRFVVFANQTEPDARKTAQTSSTPQPQQPRAQSSQANATLPSAAPSVWDQIVNFFSGIFGNNKRQSNQTQQQNQTQNPNQPQHLPEIN